MMRIACRISLLGDFRIRNVSDMGLHRVTSQPEEGSGRIGTLILRLLPTLSLEQPIFK